MRYLICLPLLLSLLYPYPGSAQNGGTAPQPPSYNQGMQQYTAGDYGAAASIFQDVLRANGTSRDAQYWLGMSYYQQNKLGDAKKQFRNLTGTFSTYAKAYHGLGLVYLKERNKAFNALDAFRQASQIDPNDPDAYYHMGVVYLTMMSRGPLAEHPYVDKALQAFEHALELDPQHKDAAYQLGVLYEGLSRAGVYNPNETDSFYTMVLPFEGKALDTMSAMAAYQRQVKIEPDHREAQQALATLHSRLGNHDVALKTFEWLAKDVSPDAETLMDLALAYWRAKNWQKAQETFNRIIPMLPEDEQLIYTDFALFTAKNEAKQYNKATDEEQAHIWTDFFAMRDPNPVTEANERLIEHYGRVAYARRAFGKVKFPWDQRGNIVVRYGLPDHVEEGTDMKEFAAGDGAMTWSRRSWREYWFYVHLPMTLYFDNRMFSRRYDFPPVYESQNDQPDAPYYVARDMIKKTPEQHIPRELGLPLDFAYDAVVYRNEDGVPLLEVAYGLPPNDETPYEAGMIDRAVDMGTVLYGPEWERVVVDSLWSPLFVPTEDPVPGLAVAIQEIEAPAGSYLMAVQAHDRIGHWFGVQRDSIMIPDYSSDGVKISGIRLATQISTDVEDPDLAMRGGFRLAPNPARHYTHGTPVHFYLELYDLTSDQNGETRYEIDIAVSIEDETMEGRHAIWRLLSRAEQMIRADREGQTVTMNFEQIGTESTVSWSSAIDTIDLEPGRYRLRVTINDLISNDSATADRMFWVEEKE